MKNIYKIILVQDNKYLETLGVYSKKEKALSRFNEFIKKNEEEIVFPMKNRNTKGIKEVKYNIVLLKKKEYSWEQPDKLPNEYGEYVEHKTNDENWYVYDIHSYNKEETFFVYGYNPRYQRKTFQWIYENIVKPKASNSNTFLSLKLYKNKIVFYDGTKHDMVICKNKSDAIRMYNLIEEFCKNDKLKYIIFYGDFSLNLKKSHEIIQEIMKFTNWNSRKVTRYCTRP